MNYKSTPVYNSMKSGKQYVNKRINREIEITKKFKQKFWKGRIQGMKLQMQYRTSMADLTKKKK